MPKTPDAAPVCLCSDVDDSDGSASAEDNPSCPIHGWDEQAEWDYEMAWWLDTMPLPEEGV